ncbi:hypothetical protein KY330_00355 [Candidatus Woesearchaeota archaeon]|nr:hypothetical protein [Candidatus Woesearchaeota archaeon]
MDIGLFAIIVAIVLLVIAIVLKLMKKAVKLALFVGMFVTALLLMGGYQLYTDSMNFKDAVGGSENTFLFVDDVVVAGFNSKFESGEDIEVISAAQISEFNQYYQDEEYEEMVDDAYKIFFVHKNTFQGLDEVEFGGQMYDRDYLMRVLDSDEPSSFFPGLDVPDANELKAVVFASMLSRMMEDEGSFFIFSQIKEGNIEVYPETPVFKFVKYVPEKFLKKFIEVEEE